MTTFVFPSISNTAITLKARAFYLVRSLTNEKFSVVFTAGKGTQIETIFFFENGGITWSSVEHLKKEFIIVKEIKKVTFE